jgi:putative tricarboxylic transport membrane protein
VRRTDRLVGLALALLGIAVLWTARSFPDVPGQDLGAATLPTIVGAGLLACALLLVRRSFFDRRRYAAEDSSTAVQAAGTVSPSDSRPSDGVPEPARAVGADVTPSAPVPALDLQRPGPPLVMLAAILLYILLSEQLGYLIVAPISVLMGLLALRVRPLPAIGWAILASAVVHVAFYKLLKVPLPWGLVRPFY